MRSSVCAVAVAVVALLAPSVASAGPDDPAQIQFKVPKGMTVEDFEALGFNMDHAMQRTADGGALVSAWVTDEQLASARAHGFEPVATIADNNAIDRIRAEREATIAAEQAARRALRGSGSANRGSRSAAAGTVRAQRADYFENNVGRFLSIEATTSLAQVTCDEPFDCAYSGPPIAAEWFDAAGNRLGGGTSLRHSTPASTRTTTSTTRRSSG